MEQCLRCGRSVTGEAAAPVEVGGERCPSCDATLAAGADWCSRCLARVPVGVAAGASAPLPPSPWASSPPPWKSAVVAPSWAEPEARRTVRYAGWWARFLGNVIDDFLFAAVSVGLLLAVQLRGSGLIVLFVVWNRVVRLGATGQSLGRMLMGIRVVDADTHKPIGTWRALGRLVARLVDALPFGLGFLWQVFDKRRRTFSDMVAGTVVIR